ncbi:IPGA1-LIKE2 [Hibiscus trionum]|uniref:IPGA1-LIKE2 n=1 Tax=Hibiscus trionum TaxID=183268 RepID=A0A9W7ITR5_HIBTR|nr:IPGA1-LIKE2 [Hibiscus trionum]
MSQFQSTKDQPARPKSVSLVMNNKPKSGDQMQVWGCYQKGRVVEQFGRPRRCSNGVKEATSSPEKNGVDELREKLGCSEGLVKDLQAQMMGLRAELDGARSLNMELEFVNRKLKEDLAAAEAKIAALSSPHPDQVQLQKRESNGEYQTPKFKDIQKLIANKLEHPKVVRETRTVKAPLRATPKDAGAQTSAAIIHSLPQPPPPPLPQPPAPPRLPAKGSTIPKAPSLIVDLLTRKEKKKDPSAAWNQKKPTVVSVQSSIVVEIQNRSAHLLAIKADVETKGEFINSLINRVLAAAYTDIEDVVKFVDWLDKELSSLADERAVLKHFKWPERKADAMREAAVEYRDLKLLETEISSYEDVASIPCGVALKRMAGLLDKSEKSIQRLIQLRNSVMRSYQECKIPVDWMLDSGMVYKIKQASIKLVTMYIKRVGTELQLVRSLDKESAQEALLLQGMHFANRAHQFAGDLDSETLCAFEEIRQCIPGHLVGSKELLTGISSA